MMFSFCSSSLVVLCPAAHIYIQGPLRQCIPRLLASAMSISRHMQKHTRGRDDTSIMSRVITSPSWSQVLNSPSSTRQGPKHTEQIITMTMSRGNRHMWVEIMDIIALSAKLLRSRCMIQARLPKHSTLPSQSR